MTYADLNTKFLYNNNEINPITIDLKDVKEGLLRLLQTRKGSNPFNREYGSSLYDLLFENDVSAGDIQMFLYMDITNWEPRVQLSPTDISIAQTGRNEYQVTCAFTVPGLNNASSFLTSTISKE